MTIYMLDIETTGTDYKKDDIFTIKYKSCNSKAESYGNLIILNASPDSSEEEIIKKFYKIFIIDNKYWERFKWDFIPIGENLMFDLVFLYNKFKKYGLEVPDFEEFVMKKPYLDIKSILVIMNDFGFKGSGLSQMMGEEGHGQDVPDWIKQKDFDKIQKYNLEETEEFFKALKIIYDNLKKFKLK